MSSLLLGHDISQEFYNNGADVTMVQRGSTLVMSSEPGVGMLLKPAYMEGGPPTEVCFPILLRGSRYARLQLLN